MPQKEYEVTLGDFVTPYIDHYVNNVRPKLYGATLGSPFVFCSENKFSPYGRGPVGEQYLQHLIRRVTERHWGVDVGPHAWRHIVATQILKTDPRNIAGAAAVLNDAESTIRRHYGHLMPNDAFKSFTELADRMANERKKGGG